MGEEVSTQEFKGSAHGPAAAAEETSCLLKKKTMKNEKTKTNALRLAFKPLGEDSNKSELLPLPAMRKAARLAQEKGAR